MITGGARISSRTRSLLLGILRARVPRAILWLALVQLSCALPALAQNRGFHAVFSRDGTDAWAVGDSGLFYRSFDGGLIWTKGTLGSSHLRDVVAVGLSVTIVGDSGKIWRSTNSGGAWSLQVVGGAPSLRALSMPTATVGFAVGAAGTILKTQNGGASWTPQSSGTTRRLNAVHFAGELDGWAAGENGTLLSTHDGGATWTPVTSGTTRELFSVMQRGASVWAVGAFGTALESVNGGTSFAPVNLKLDAKSDVRCVWLQSPDSVYLVGGGGFIRSSADGGQTWSFPMHNMHGQIADLHFAGPTGFVVSNKNLLPMSSIDAGVTWRFPTNATLSRSWEQRLSAGSVYGNTFSTNPDNPATFYVAIGAGIYRSFDEGENWHRIASFPSGVFQCNAFIVSPKDTNVWVAAVGGNPKRLLKSDDYGQSWFTTLTHDYGVYGVPVEYDHDHPDTFYFGGDADGLFRSTDGGKNWERLSSNNFRSPCDILVVPDSSNIVIVADGITTQGQAQYYKSIDSGQTFTLKMTRPPGAYEIPELATSRLRPNVIFGTNWGGGGVQRSEDFGDTWPTINLTSFAWGVDVARDDPNLVMFGVYGGGTSYLSIDGGTSFTGNTIMGSNYSFHLRDRGLILAEQINGVYKMRFNYQYTPADSQRLNLTSPNGGEIWRAGTTQQITWTASHVALVAIEMRASADEPWQHIAEVPGYYGRSSWTVPSLASSQVKLRVRDAWDASPEDTSDVAFTTTSGEVSVDPRNAGALALVQNRPNPFTGTTRIAFTLPSPSDVTLEVFDLEGHRVATLARGPHSAGEHSVEFGPGVRAVGARRRTLHAGVFYYRLTAGTRSITRKMLYLK